MLTRLEVRGFKNLHDVAIDLGPFTCIAGTNGIGKSNIFDAIYFLSRAAAEPLVEAARKVRASSDLRAGDPRDLFWDGYGTHDKKRLYFGVEMLVPPVVEDELGARAETTTTFLRYELEIGYERPDGLGSAGRLTLEREELRHIKKGDASKHLRFPHSAKNFRDAVVLGKRFGSPYLSTEEKDGVTVINMHGDGSSGRPQPRAAGQSGRTILSTVATNDHPTILAARREMENWRLLALEPSALRKPDSFDAPRTLGADGSHLAATLYRIANATGLRPGETAEDIYARVANRLSDLTGLDIESIEVERDQVREVFSLSLTERGGLRLQARALSEGTLRFLALCVLLEDPTFTGLICMEEPENGIHPANLEAIVSLVKDLAVDADESPSDDNPFRQVIVNTHSPGVLQLCDPDDLILADIRRTRGPDGRSVRALELMPRIKSWRAQFSLRTFSDGDIIPYLTAPAGAQLQLPIEIGG